MPSKPNARTKPPRLVLFDTIPELPIITGSISEMINSPTKVRPQNSPNSPIASTFGSFITASNNSIDDTANTNTNTAKFSPTLPSPASPTSITTPLTNSTQQNTPEPSPPTTPPMLPPPAPYPWLWSCHSCRSVYRLACTRRCLECGHIFCCLMPAANEGGSQERDKSGGGKKRKRSGSSRRGGGPCTAEFDYLGWSAWGSYRRSVAGAAARRAASKVAAPASAAATGNESGRKKSGSGSGSSSSGKRSFGGVSMSPFPSPPPSSSSSSQDSTTTTTTTTDSEGQSAEDKAIAARLQDFATWHLVPVGSTESSDSTNKQTLAWHHVPERETRSIARLKEKMYVERVHNCWSHCDYPSECRQTIIAACEEGRAKIDRKGRKLVWVDDREKDAIEARRRRDRERERENLKRTLAGRKSRAGQERSQRSGRRGRVQGSGNGNGNGITGKKQKWEWELEPVVEEEEVEDVEMGDHVHTEKDGDSSSLSSVSSSAGGNSSSFSSSDSSGSEDDEGLSISNWKATMTATMTSGTQKGPDDDNTGNLTIAMLEPFSRVDGCSSRQDCYITVVTDDTTIDPAKLLKDNDMETIPLSPVSPLAGGCLASSIAEASTYQSFASFNDFGPMEIDDMAM